MDIDKLKIIINQYGVEKQKIKAIEELSELIKAICKDDIINLKDEIADCYIMLKQLEIIYQLQEIIPVQIDFKINRTLKHIKGVN